MRGITNNNKYLFLNILVDNLIFYLLNIILIVDSINGYFMNIGYHLPISQLYKNFLIFLIFIRVLSFSKIRITIIIFFSYVLFFLVYYLFKENGELLAETSAHIMKFFFIVLTFFYFKHVIQKNPETFYKKILLVINICFIILVINLLLGIMGFGFSSYENTLGTKGSIYSGNELGGLIIVLFSFYIYFFSYYLQISKLKKLFFFFFLLVLALICSSKTAILGTIISLLVVPYIVKKQKGITSNININKIIFFICIIVAVALFLFWGISETGILARWTFFYRKGNLLLLLTSGRLNYVKNEIWDYINSDIFGYIFGLGGFRTVEMDFFDTLLNYGIMGIILVYTFLMYLLIMANKNRKRKIFPFASLALFINILLAVVSFVVGHILFSAMLGLFISIVNALAFYKLEPIPQT